MVNYNFYLLASGYFGEMEVEGYNNYDSERSFMGKIGCACGKMLYREENGVYYFWCKNCKKEIPFVFVDANGNPARPVMKRIREIEKRT